MGPRRPLLGLTRAGRSRSGRAARPARGGADFRAAADASRSGPARPLRTVPDDERRRPPRPDVPTRPDDALSRLAGAIEWTPALIPLTGLDHRSAHVDRAVVALLGRPEEELIGPGHQGVTHPDDLDADDSRETLARADEALYAAKRRGGGCFAAADAERVA